MPKSTKQDVAGFLDIIPPNKKDPKIIRDLYKFMVERLEHNCKSFGIHCPNCEAWVAYARLQQLFQE